MDSGLSTKSSIKANPYTIQIKCDGEDSSEPKSSDAMLPRKVSRVNYIGTCTENRHRWQGEYPKVSERTMVKELGKMTP